MKRRFAVLLVLFASLLAPASVRAQTVEPPVVRAVMFWQAGCSHCEETINVTLPPIQEKYGAQFELLLIELKDMQDIELLYRVAASYGLPKQKTRVPFLIIGNQELVGVVDIAEKLPALIDDYLAQDGVGWPSNPLLSDLLPASSPTSGLPAVTQTPIPADFAPASPADARSNGFTLAIVIMVFMAAILIYSLIAFAIGKTFPLPHWADWLIPALIIIGIGVAGYLSYIETQSVTAACGPVGDCNAVQQSRYARLFDVLPIGVLGLLGYLGLIAAWLVRKYLPKFAKPAYIAFFGMAFFAVTFSLYLTYLEPFVIGAVCIWCLSSAVIVTLLLLFGTPPAIRQFSVADEE